MDHVTRILGIETSCDETAVAVLEVGEHATCNTQHVTSEMKPLKVSVNLVSSQIPIHQKYGGVVPEVAARSHVPEAVSLITQALQQVPLETIDALAVTRGPGLATALGVGIESARALAAFSGKPLIGVNHLEGHIASAWLNDENRAKWEFPLLVLTVSGGHTELVLVRDWCRYKIVGGTRDDAAGEAFDKSAKLMGMLYPGGPKIAKLAERGNSTAFALPRPMLKDGTFDFSFSGLKTAVRQLWEGLPERPVFDEANPHPLLCDVAASLQAAIVEVLVEKTLAAAKKYKVKGVCLVGGVSANASLRLRLGEGIAQRLPGVAYLPSDRKYVTDNAAMIATAGYWRFLKEDFVDWKRIEVRPEWGLK